MSASDRLRELADAIAASAKAGEPLTPADCWAIVGTLDQEIARMRERERHHASRQHLRLVRKAA